MTNNSGLGKSLQKKKKPVHRSEEEWCGQFTVTEPKDSVQEFIGITELSGTDFTAERHQNPTSSGQSELVSELPLIIGSEGTTATSKDHLNQSLQIFCVPRRPQWDESIGKEDFQSLEKKAFIEWQRQIASFENGGIALFERNIHLWRQLWGVIEKSDIIVQVVDARNPLLFRCRDLVREQSVNVITMLLFNTYIEKYVSEVDPCKVNMILLSKSDLLSSTQRRTWLEYFQAEGIPVAFWSSKTTEKSNSKDSTPSNETGTDNCTITNTAEKDSNSDSVPDTSSTVDDSNRAHIDDGLPMSVSDDDQVDHSTGATAVTDGSRILSLDELLTFFRKLYLNNPAVNSDSQSVPDCLSVGLVGYPNVGKSSTINALLRTKVVPVSATPGKTKHFQTIQIGGDLLLCDSPGLTFPNPAATKAELLCYGILPIDQMKDYVPSISLICSKIPRAMLERVYGIDLPVPMDRDRTRPSSPQELLSAYGRSRGFMIAKGVSDNARSARKILKDFVNGDKLLYCEPPPGYGATAIFNEHLQLEPQTRSKVIKKSDSEIDEIFFKKEPMDKCQVVYINNEGRTLNCTNVSSTKKPYKKHNNRYKRK